MPAYHSTLNELQTQEVCGCALLPIKTRSRGPAPPAPNDQDDIVDEIIQLFRANVMFTNFEIKGNADRVLIYGTLFVHLCLKKLDKCTTKADGKLFTLVRSALVVALWMLACGEAGSNECMCSQCARFLFVVACLCECIATRVLQQTAVDAFAIPGDSAFPLGGLVRAPTSANEAGLCVAFPL